MIPRLALTLEGHDRIELVVFSCISSVDLERPISPARVLSPNERQAYSQIRQPTRRQDYLIGRLAAKTAVAERINRKDLARISIEPGGFEQPVLRGSSAHGTSVTLAHSQSAALAIAYDSGHPFGVDIEHVARKERLALNHQRLPARTINRGCARLSRVELSYLIWTIREAMSKALLIGLTCSPTLFDIDTLEIRKDGACTGNFVLFKQHQFCAWIAGSFSVAVVCPKSTALQAHLRSMMRFTRANLRL
jgi:4'-phosphopantetheinyl transferase